MSVNIASCQMAGVIDKSLLDKKAEAQGLRLEQLRNLSLHSLSIKKIDHLWIFDKLNVLKLSENKIEKIENLEKLVNLTELNLSFNKIRKIENLNTLLKLEKLSLHSNEISKLESLECLNELQLLSVSKNRLDTLDNVIYLRKLKNLHALSLEENPLCDNENYKDFIIAFLPRLQYYDYKLVNREKELDMNYKQKLAKLEEDEEEARLQEQQNKETMQRNEILQEGFVDSLEVIDLLTNLQQPRWNAVLQVGSETAITMQNEYKEQMQKVCHELQELGLEQLGKRNEELRQFEQCLQQASEANRQESMSCVDDFLSPKETMYRSIRKIITDMEKKRTSNDDSNTDLDVLKDTVYQFNQKVDYLWHCLMVLEVELQEQIEDVTKVFEINMKTLVTDFIEEAKTLLLQAQDLEEQFHLRVEAPCQLRATNLRLQMHNETVNTAPVLNKTAVQLTSDPAVLHDCLRECHEERLDAIKERESKLEEKCQAWMEKLIKDINMKAFKRSRFRVLEINNFLDMQRKEISDLQATSIAFMGLL